MTFSGSRVSLQTFQLSSQRFRSALPRESLHLSIRLRHGGPNCITLSSDSQCTMATLGMYCSRYFYIGDTYHGNTIGFMESSSPSRCCPHTGSSPGFYHPAPKSWLCGPLTTCSCRSHSTGPFSSHAPQPSGSKFSSLTHGPYCTTHSPQIAQPLS